MDVADLILRIGGDGIAGVARKHGLVGGDRLGVLALLFERLAHVKLRLRRVAAEGGISHDGLKHGLRARHGGECFHPEKPLPLALQEAPRDIELRLHGTVEVLTFRILREILSVGVKRRVVVAGLRRKLADLELRFRGHAGVWEFPHEPAVGVERALGLALVFKRFRLLQLRAGAGFHGIILVWRFRAPALAGAIDHSGTGAGRKSERARDSGGEQGDCENSAHKRRGR